MNRRHLLAGLASALIGLASPAPASAQSGVPRQGVPYGTYRPAAPRYIQRAPSRAFRGQRGAYSLPYNRSPYTDDWSTARHLPFPKPWMLPTRDPAYRGR